MARSVNISAMLRHLLTMRNADAESFKCITMMNGNDGPSTGKKMLPTPREYPVLQVQDSVASHAASHLPRGQNSKGPDLEGHWLHRCQVASRWPCHPGFGHEPRHTLWSNDDVKFHLTKKLSCLRVYL